MNFSTKIRKFYEGMCVYERLLDDEKAIHLPFALSFTVTITTILEQLKAFLADLEKGVCREIPDIDYDIMTDVVKVMSKKLRTDMIALGMKTVRQLLEELFGAHLDKTPLEMHDYIYDSTRQMTERIHQIHKGVKHADPALFEDYFLNHIREHNWDDVNLSYERWKGHYSEVTMEMLVEKQEEVINKALERDVMRFVTKPTKNKLEKVDYDYHINLLDCDFKATDDYKKAYAKLMRFAKREDGLLKMNCKEYGRYIFDNFCQFSEGQKVALFELYINLTLIHKDMAELNPELGKHLAKTDEESLEGTRYFAVFINLLQVFKEPWFDEFRTDKKYDEAWVRQFLQDLLKSKWRDEIAAEWYKANNKKKLLGYLLGCLIKAGVIKDNNSAVAVAVMPFVKFDEKRIKPVSFASYFSEGRKKGYQDWICDYVNL